jgi:hypothetical protein
MFRACFVQTFVVQHNDLERLPPAWVVACGAGSRVRKTRMAGGERSQIQNGLLSADWGSKLGPTGQEIKRAVFAYRPQLRHLSSQKQTESHRVSQLGVDRRLP